MLSITESKKIAGEAAIQNLLNCYIRESGQTEWQTAGTVRSSLAPLAGRDGLLVCKLAKQHLTVIAGVDYWSPTGRHLFAFPVYYQAGKGELIEADYTTLSALLVKELSLEAGRSASADELMLRILQSTRNVEAFALARENDANELYGSEFDFKSAEQALVFGHLLHPTPKSRQGIPDEQNALYSPELKGAFQLHYFRAHRSIVVESSALPFSAAELIVSELKGDREVSRAWLDANTCVKDWVLLPAHPLQAKWLLEQPYVQQAIQQGLLVHVGAHGSPYYATSSLRTVYRQEAKFMYKFSIPVKITNSLRVNKYKELERGVEVKKLLGTAVGEVRSRYEGFDIVTDPSFITLRLGDGEESGFELVLRDNPFRWDAARGATPIAALVQDPLPGNKSRLATVITRIAEQEGRTAAEVSADWFDRYLELSLKPMVWLYLTWGIALEAHQQNSVVQLENGYPRRFYYRDNQGYYFCKSMEGQLAEQLPGIGEWSQTVCEDAVADERFRYYLIFNHMFGLINGFGTAGLIDERVLLRKLREALASFEAIDRKPSVFLRTLLTEAELPCKANLLTRLYDMDELVGALESQSLYVMASNPLVKEVAHGEQQQQHERSASDSAVTAG